MDEESFPVPNAQPLPIAFAEELAEETKPDQSAAGNSLHNEFSGSALAELERLGVHLVSSDVLERNVVKKALRHSQPRNQVFPLGFGDVLSGLPDVSAPTIRYSLSLIRQTLSKKKEELAKLRQQISRGAGGVEAIEKLKALRDALDKERIKENVLIVLEATKSAKTGPESGCTEHTAGEDAPSTAAAAETTIGGLSLEETERERLIRLGRITPFDKIEGLEKSLQRDGAADSIEVTAVPRPAEETRRRSMMDYKLGKEQRLDANEDDETTDTRQRDKKAKRKKLKKRKKEKRKRSRSDLPAEGEEETKESERTGGRSDGVICPVCQKWVRGGADGNQVLNRHMDRCLTRRTPRTRNAESREEGDLGSEEGAEDRESIELSVAGSSSGSEVELSESSSSESESSREREPVNQNVKTALGGSNQRRLRRLRTVASQQKSNRKTKTLRKSRRSGQSEEEDQEIASPATRRASAPVPAGDDGDSDAYRERKERFRQFERSYSKRLRKEQERQQLGEAGQDADLSYSNDSDSDEDEAIELMQLEDHDPDEHFGKEEIILDGGLRIPNYIYRKLYGYQRIGVKWLWELFCQKAGGIVGDEMGLGKTIQMAAFLASLAHSNRLQTTLIAAPASVLGHWVRELRRWYPAFRVMLLHVSGSSLSSRSRVELVEKVAQEGGILVTTYEGVRLNSKILLHVKWDYVVLDEGHKIRNPDAEITLICKRFQTVNRIILTGSPIQNNLRELWSLFDFAFPGRLGTLPTFENEFALPIRLGGYANASGMQVQMAYKCALILRDLINPYLLRRMKKDVQNVAKLPAKTEQVLFCKLTEDQKREYKAFLNSQEVADVLDYKVHAFRAITILRKICNHPDLMHEVKQRLPNGTIYKGTNLTRPDDYGSWRKAGKLLVVDQILPLWKEQGHRVLFFTQTRQMLDIIQQYVEERGWNFFRLDGSTTIKSRQPLIDRFNEDPSIFIFLLTTRAGGLGVNLIGANRVLLYDPDWNPSTDIQARERAWRLGQLKSVTIYRLITNGTIEEKIYHRQIYKQFLTNKILKDPKQRRFFKSRDLRDLFTFTEEDHQGEADAVNETTDLFPSGKVQITRRRRRRDDSADVSVFDKRRKYQVEEPSEEGSSSDAQAAGEEEKRDNKAILEALVNGRDLKGVFQHGVVEKGGGLGGERQIVEAEASLVAKRALDALKRSTLAIRRTTGFTPTWTGSHGNAGAPKQSAPRPRFGASSAAAKASPSQPSREEGARTSNVVAGLGGAADQDGRSGATPLNSKDLLQRIKQRQQQTASPASRGLNLLGNEEVARITGAATDKRHIELIESLHRALTAAGETGMSSSEVVEEFGDRIGPADKLVFRQMLRELATYRGGVWYLKEDLG